MWVSSGCRLTIHLSGQSLCVTPAAFALGTPQSNSPSVLAAQFKRYPIDHPTFRITGRTLPDSRPLSDSPETVTDWLTGARPYLLSRTELDLDVILECSFSIDQLIVFFNTTDAIEDRKSWLAGALWRTVELIVKDDFDHLDPKPDPKTISMLAAFVTLHINEFKSLGCGQGPDCEVLQYIKDLQIDEDSS